MEDEVKITVIATGFRSAQGVHHDRSHAVTPITQPRIAVHNSGAGAAGPVMEEEPEPGMEAEPARQPDPVQEAAATPVSPREYASLEEVKSSVKGSFEDDDLDVPAFIRKRVENL